MDDDESSDEEFICTNCGGIIIYQSRHDLYVCVDCGRVYPDGPPRRN